MTRAKETTQQRNARRVRFKLKTNNRAGLPRLSVHRTNNQIYAQVIDDANGVTLAAASTLDKDLKLKSGANVDAASQVGKLVGERAKKAGVSKVMFDRGAFLYHGRVKALADGARAAGLEF